MCQVYRILIYVAQPPIRPAVEMQRYKTCRG
jgi:hypothetical protein